MYYSSKKGILLNLIKIKKTSSGWRICVYKYRGMFTESWYMYETNSFFEKNQILINNTFM